MAQFYERKKSRWQHGKKCLSAEHPRGQHGERPSIRGSKVRGKVAIIFPLEIHTQLLVKRIAPAWHSVSAPPLLLPSFSCALTSCSTQQQKPFPASAIGCLSGSAPARRLSLRRKADPEICLVVPTKPFLGTPRFVHPPVQPAARYRKYSGAAFVKRQRRERRQRRRREGRRWPERRRAAKERRR